MENGPFIDDFTIKATIYSGFSMAMLNTQMVMGTKRDVLMFLLLIRNQFVIT